MRFPAVDPLEQVTLHLRAALDGIGTLRIAGPHASHIDYPDLADRVRKLSLQRAALIPEMEFFDPGWNMLLDIYVAASRGRKLSVSDVCEGCGAPPTTGLRYIKTVVGKGLAERVQDQLDGRRIYIVVTPTGQSAVERWLDAFVAAFR